MHSVDGADTQTQGKQGFYKCTRRQLLQGLSKPPYGERKNKNSYNLVEMKNKIKDLKIL